MWKRTLFIDREYSSTSRFIITPGTCPFTVRSRRQERCSGNRRPAQPAQLGPSKNHSSIREFATKWKRTSQDWQVQSNNGQFEYRPRLVRIPRTDMFKIDVGIFPPFKRIFFFRIKHWQSWSKSYLVLCVKSENAFTSCFCQFNKSSLCYPYSPIPFGWPD